MNHDDLIERLETAEVREPKKPSGQYVTTLGNQAAAALRELVAERDLLKAENERLRSALEEEQLASDDMLKELDAERQRARLPEELLRDILAALDKNDNQRDSDSQNMP